MTVERVDFMAGGGEAGDEFNGCVAAEEGVSIPQYCAGRTIEGCEDMPLGIQVSVIEPRE
jgi:hypothetical protein